MKQFFTTVAGIAVTAVFFCLIIGVPILLIFGVARVAEPLMPWLYRLSLGLMALDVCLLLPLAVVPVLRPVCGSLIFVSSYIFGLFSWLMGLLFTWSLWGGFAVILGLFIMGVGVVPMGMIACAFKGMWAEAGILLLSLVLTFAFRLAGVAVMGTTPEREAI